MLLKKQTVWLLTMLSLVVVLSVYYITSPESRLNEFAATEEDNNKAKGNDAEEAKEAAKDSKGESTVTTTDSEAVFEQMRLDLMEQRDKMKEELVSIQGSKDKTAEEKMKLLKKSMNFKK